MNLTAVGSRFIGKARFGIDFLHRLNVKKAFLDFSYCAEKISGDKNSRSNLKTD